ncbi:MAG TPA: YafY family protein [Candidatus Baltobacteraceae bacterium]|jgi:predicted DNA-binding transcriptional regulator YafY|nr:YafY family protein [Candidatus Baltobacteraceae bacterium]
MKSERLVSLMLLLQARSPRSARDLARTLEVSMRTVYRDVDALSTTGVPVYAERGPNGGITLSDGYRQAIAQFSTDELHALFVAAADPLADLGIAAHERALHKIRGALPDLQRRAAEKAGQRILLDHNRWYRSEQPAHILASLRRAVWDDRAVLLTYRDRNGALTTREIDPLGLISKAGVWYVAARIPNGELRTFRAERIEHVEELRRQFSRPADFDLHGFWLNATSKPDHENCAYEATLRFEGDATESIMPYFPAEAIEQDASGKTYRVRFPSQDAAVGHVMMLGKRAQVVGPDDFRSAVVARARELLAILSG